MGWALCESLEGVPDTVRAPGGADATTGMTHEDWALMKDAMWSDPAEVRSCHNDNEKTNGEDLVTTATRPRELCDVARGVVPYISQRTFWEEQIWRKREKKRQR